jgi:hypothetical protein
VCVCACVELRVTVKNGLFEFVDMTGTLKCGLCEFLQLAGR